MFFIIFFTMLMFYKKNNFFILIMLIMFLLLLIFMNTIKNMFMYSIFMFILTCFNGMLLMFFCIISIEELILKFNIYLEFFYYFFFVYFFNISINELKCFKFNENMVFMEMLVIFIFLFMINFLLVSMKFNKMKIKFVKI